MQHSPKVSDKNPGAATDIETVKNNLRKLQKTKNYKALGQAGGLSVEKSHCGWGWRSLDDSSIADDLPYEAEAWEAGCFESGLMEDVDQMDIMLSEEVLRSLGLISK